MLELRFHFNGDVKLNGALIGTSHEVYEVVHDISEWSSCLKKVGSDVAVQCPGKVALLIKEKSTKSYVPGDDLSDLFSQLEQWARQARAAADERKETAVRFWTGNLMAYGSSGPGWSEAPRV